MLASAMLLEQILERRLVVLSGKGGVGKSVVGAALALAARDRGRKVLLAEVDAPLEAARRFGAAASEGREVEVRPGLFAVNLRPRAVMDEYVRHVVKLDFVVRRIVDSPVYDRFFTAAPGLKELMVLGKLVSLSQASEGFARKPRYDLVIVDAPATGHGLSFLKVPIAAAAAIPGPIGTNARWILGHLRDRKHTATLIVSIPEEMAAVEAIEFHRVATEEIGLAPLAVLLNACHERRFTPAQEALLPRLSLAAPAGQLAPGVSLTGALRAARHHVRRRKLSAFYLRRLQRALPLPVIPLPYLFEERLDPDALRRLAARLAAA